MRSVGTKRLETDRLILRRFELDDADIMFKDWAGDEQVTRYLTWDTHKTVEDTKSILKEWIENYKNLDFYQWCIVSKESNRPMGSIGAIYREEYNIYEIGYCIGRDYWNKGYASEFLKRIIDFFLEDLSVDKVMAKHHIDNLVSGKVMKNAGMIFSGEELSYSDSLKYYNTRIYMMTRELWEEIKEK